MSRQKDALYKVDSVIPQPPCSRESFRGEQCGAELLAELERSAAFRGAEPLGRWGSMRNIVVPILFGIRLPSICYVMAKP